MPKQKKLYRWRRSGLLASSLSTLQAIAVPQQQAQSSQLIHFKVHIRNAEGEHVMTTIDGEVVDEASPI